MPNVKKCNFCGKIGDHSTFYCPSKPRPSLKTNKPLPKLGKQGKRTQKAVNEWKSTQSSNHQGYFICYICGRWIEYLMAEHVKGKARHPEDRENQDNLKQTCADCNAKKGSRDLTEL